MKNMCIWRCRECKRDTGGPEKTKCAWCGSYSLAPRNLEAFMKLNPKLFSDNDNDMENGLKLLKMWSGVNCNRAKIMDFNVDITDLRNYLKNALLDGALLGEHVVLYGAGLFELGIEVTI